MDEVRPCRHLLSRQVVAQQLPRPCMSQASSRTHLTIWKAFDVWLYAEQMDGGELPKSPDVSVTGYAFAVSEELYKTPARALQLSECNYDEPRNLIQNMACGMPTERQRVCHWMSCMRYTFEGEMTRKSRVLVRDCCG